MNNKKVDKILEKKNIRFSKASEDLFFIKNKYGIADNFIRALKDELKSEIWEQDCFLESYREDLRNHFVITIDGQDSKDLDDAISVTYSWFRGWTLAVHVADVSYYVPQYSALDAEAFNKANSYYFINQVIPMLPKKLSNDLCSLNPHQDKKAMTIFINFNKFGKVTGYRITPSVIKTSYRMTYDRVQQIMTDSKEKDSKLLKNIQLMDKLFQILHKNRLQNGSVDFNFQEQKITLDHNGEPVKIYKKDRMDSERLIEEFMLIANQVAGEFLTKNGIGLYRVHDIPPSEKYQRLKNFAAKRGYILPEIPKTKDLQVFIASLSGSPLQMSGEILTLRSMAQAVYQEENIGHFGLGFELYAHFTSPIRRYADLVVHRIIKYYLFKNEYKKAPYTKEELDKIATHISAQERIAMEAERELFKIKSVRYMKKFEGKVLSGIVSSVASFGIFIEILETGIEAMIRYSDMKEYMIFDEEELQAKDKSGKKVYKIGMPIKIQITKVNIERGFIDAIEVKS